LSDEVVKLTEAESEAEAVMICGYLQSAGIQATYDRGGVLGPPMGGLGGGLSVWGSGQFSAGRQEILIHARDLAKAQAALAELPK
jgi:putative signal transducing protein